MDPTAASGAWDSQVGQGQGQRPTRIFRCSFRVSVLERPLMFSSMGNFQHASGETLPTKAHTRWRSKHCWSTSVHTQSHKTCKAPAIMSQQSSSRSDCIGLITMTPPIAQAITSQQSPWEPPHWLPRQLHLTDHSMEAIVSNRSPWESPCQLPKQSCPNNHPQESPHSLPKQSCPGGHLMEASPSNQPKIPAITLAISRSIVSQQLPHNSLCKSLQQARVIATDCPSNHPMQYFNSIWSSQDYQASVPLGLARWNDTLVCLVCSHLIDPLSQHADGRGTSFNPCRYAGLDIIPLGIFKSAQIFCVTIMRT